MSGVANAYYCHSEILPSPSLEILKTCLDMVLCSLL